MADEKTQKPSRPLSHKHRRFVEEYCKDWNAARASVRAGYTDNPKAIYSTSSEIFLKPQVQEAIKARMDELARQCAVTTETITNQLLEDRQLAHASGQAGAAVSASMGLAKLHGLITDKQELTGKNGSPLVPGKMLVELVDPADIQSPDPA